MASDLVTLSWCLAEIRQALSQADQLLERHLLAEQGDLAGLRAARALVHQAHGALQVVDIEGVALLTQESEALLDAVERGDVAFSADLVSRLGQASQALIEYLEELLQGVPPQPLSLYPYYRALLEARKAERIHPADLFFPDLSGAPVPATHAGARADVGELAGARGAFERGLLQSIREPGSNAGPQLMHSAIRAVRDSVHGDANPAFWWVTQVYFDALRRALLPMDVTAKRLLARFNLQLRKTLEERAPVSDRLLKDMLFSLAGVPAGDPEVDRIRQAYRLDGAVPADFEKPKYGRVDAKAMRAARDALAKARTAFDKVTRGSANDMPGFAQGVDAFRDAVEQLPAKGLQSIGRVLGDVRRTLNADSAYLPEPVALELATTILYAEQALAQGARPDSNHDQHGAEMAARLSAALAGKDQTVEPPDWLRALSQAAQERLTMSTFIAEAQSSLRQVEKVLDGYFRDPAQAAALPECVKAMHQVAGALRLLGHDHAAKGAESVGAQVATFADAGARRDSADAVPFERVAASVGALGFFVEALQHPERAGAQYEFDATTGEFRARLGRSPREVQPVAAVASVPASNTAAPPVDKLAAAAAVSAGVLSLADNLSTSAEAPAGHAAPATVDSVASTNLSAEDSLAAVALEAVPAFAAWRADPLAAPALIQILGRVRDGAALVDDAGRKAAAAQALSLIQTPAPDAGALRAAMLGAGIPLPATPEPAPVLPADELAVDSELLEIFLAEADEVLEAIAEHSGLSAKSPRDQDHLTTMRRGFHTLKGSSRMVGLNEFGEAGWAMEQVLNLWLAEEKAGEPDLYVLIERAHGQFAQWVVQLRSGGGPRIDPKPIIDAANALRLGEPLPEPVPLAADPVMAVMPAVAIEPLPSLQTELAPVPEIELEPEPVFEPEPMALAADIDLADLSSPTESIELLALPEAQALPEWDSPSEAVALADTPALPELSDVPAAADDLALTVDFALADETAPEEMIEALVLSDVGDEVVLMDEDSAVFDEAASPIEAVLPASGFEAGPEIELPALETFDATQWVDEADDDLLIGEPADEMAVLGAAADEALITDRPSAVPTADASDVPADMVRVGDRLISRPLYLIFLSEADELIQTLATDTAQWREVPQREASEAAMRAVHSLAGSAAVVQLDAVHGLAETLDRAYAAQRLSACRPDDDDFSVLASTVERIHGMLHQFAAGNWPAEDAAVLASIRNLAQRWAPPARIADIATPQVFDAQTPDDAFPQADEAEWIPPGLVAAAPSAEAVLPELAEPELAEPGPVVSEQVVPEPVTPQLVTPELAEPELSATATAMAEQPARVVARPEPSRPAGLLAAGLGQHATENDALHHSGTLAPPEQVVDELDPELLAIFIEEADDDLPRVGENLRAWVESPGDARLPQTLMRLLHTVKGSARMAGAMRLGQKLHDTETRVETLAALPTPPTQLIEELVSEIDQAVAMFEALKHPAAQAVAEPVLEPALEPAAEAAHAPVAEPVVPSLAQPLAETSSASDPGIIEITAPSPATLVAAPARTGEAVAAVKPADPAVPTSHPLVRVRADLLDKLVNEAGEVSIARSRLDNELTTLRQSLADLTENVGRLRTQLREIEIQADTQIQARIAKQKEHERSFDPLEFDRYTRFQELTRMMAESVNDVATVQGNAMRSLDEASQDLHRQGQVLRDLQQNLMRVRMVQFGSISDRLYRVVRQSAKETDKRVHLDIRGTTVEVDRGVLERMAGPIEHLLRNAVAHGIESASTRHAHGKSDTGEIQVEVRQEGREIVLSFADDGSGLDLERIRLRAVSQGLISAQATPTDRELGDLIFVPGFSTAASVTELSGRGVGMDVVRSEVASLGGRIETETQPGRGTRFTVHLPLTLAVAQVVLVAAGRSRFAVPSSSVEQVLQLKPQALAAAYAERSVEWQGQNVPLFFLGTLVESPDVTPVAQHYSPVVIIRSGHQRIALHADEITRNQEVVVKNVGPQVARVRGVTGATVLGNGEIVLIVNPVALAQAAAGEVFDRAVPAPTITAVLPDALPPVVMVVDDSLTVRKVTQRLLVREGYQVLLAKDGVDALRQLQDVVPDAMLLDIEMPRMDGFDLTRNLRADERFAHLPIIMITSRTADKHRNHAMGLGVNVYLGKPYQEDELLAHLAHFTETRQRMASSITA